MGHCTVFVCRSSEPARPSLLKWLVSLLVCCWQSNSRPSSAGDSEGGDSVEMGPMTLREYIATLQPYDPEVHGWRGDEPWTLRRRARSCYANGYAGGGPGHSGDSPAYSSVSYHRRSSLRGNHVV